MDPDVAQARSRLAFVVITVVIGLVWVFFPSVRSEVLGWAGDLCSRIGLN